MINYTIEFPENYVKPKLPRGKEWVAALRSGNYTQGQNALCVDGNYCCLGVLCEIMGLEKYLGPQKIAGINSIEKEVMYYKSPTGRTEFPFIPRGTEYENILGPTGDLPFGVKIVKGVNTFFYLSAANDYGFTFPQIADIIESVYELQ